MEADRWSRIEELFHAASKLEPGQREAYLRQSTGDDESLRRAVIDLLDGDKHATDFLAHPALGSDFQLYESPHDSRDDKEGPIGKRVGAYRLVKYIASGGMGAVYLAVRDDDQYEKEVAIKLIKRGMDTDDILRRFRGERQLLATLEHPNIARLIDGGATDSGLPYLVMEYIDGQPIDQYCNDQRLGVEARLQLFDAVCDAVKYAHQNLIVHRDLKPNNIVVTRDGIPKLLDFGIAKVLDPDGVAHTVDVTMPSQRFITPAYASPEQIRGQRITTTSDVYALGVILFELLTSQRPYDADSRSLQAIERVICEEQPTRPSVAVARSTTTLDGIKSTKKVQPEASKHLARRLSGDLDNIILMALRKDPQRRYTSVEQLADDLQRHREGKPVLARPDTFRYRSAKFVARNKLVVSAVLAVTFALLGGIITSGILYVQADRAKIAAQRVSGFLQDALGSVNPQIARGRDVTLLREVLDVASKRIDEELGGNADVAATLHLTIGNTYASIALYDQAERHTRAAVKLRCKLLGDDDPQVADCLAQLARILRIKGEYESSETAIRGGIKIWELHYGPRHPKLAAAYNTLGIALESIGKAAEAQKCYRDALSINRETLAPTHPALASNLINLGQQLMNQKSEEGYDAAEPLLREALDIRRVNADKDDPNLVGALVAYGTLLQERHQFDEAELLFREALAISRRVLSPEHPDLANVLDNLATLLEFKGDYQAAEPLYRETLAIQKKSLGLRHRDVGTTINNLGGMFRRAGRYDEAIPLFKEAADIYRESLGEGHFWVTIVMQNLGASYLAKGDAIAALPVLEEALRMRKALVGDDHWRIGGLETLIGECLTSLGQYDRAEPLLLSSYEQIKKAKGMQVPYTQKALQRIIDFYIATNQPEKATLYSQRLP